MHFSARGTSGGLVGEMRTPRGGGLPHLSLVAGAFFFAWYHAFDAAQDILDGEPKLVGEGRVRRVYVAEHEGRTVAVKELRQKHNVRLHRLEVVTMDEVRSQCLGVMPTMNEGMVHLGHRAFSQLSCGGMYIFCLFAYRGICLEVSGYPGC